MDVGDFLNKVYDQSIDFGTNACVTGVIGASLGYTIAEIEGVNTRVLAQAFAIYSIAVLIFDLYCEEYIPNKNIIVNPLTAGVAFKFILSLVFISCMKEATRPFQNFGGALFAAVVITGYIFKKPIEKILNCF